MTMPGPIFLDKSMRFERIDLPRNEDDVAFVESLQLDSLKPLQCKGCGIQYNAVVFNDPIYCPECGTELFNPRALAPTGWPAREHPGMPPERDDGPKWRGKGKKP